MQHQGSRYFKRLRNQAYMHFKASVLYPLGLMSIVQFPIVEVFNAHSHRGGISYQARCDFGDGVLSEIYEIWFPVNDGGCFRVDGQWNSDLFEFGQTAVVDICPSLASTHNGYQ